MPQEHNNTYIIDAESAAEMARLNLQGQIYTQVQRGPLAERNNNFTGLRHILDIACGPGEWALDVAERAPMSTVTGIDISERMIAYARAQAQAKSLQNAQFQIMDILHLVKFPSASFDLMNARLLTGVLPSAYWPGLVQHYSRLLRPGGMIRLTEAGSGDSSSVSLNWFMGKLTQALRSSGYGFSTDGRSYGMYQLGSLLRNGGFSEVTWGASILDYSYGTPAHVSSLENARIALKLTQPFLARAGVADEQEIDHRYQSMLVEMESPTFSGIQELMTVYGTKPEE